MKRLSQPLAVVALVALLAGCGGGDAELGLERVSAATLRADRAVPLPSRAEVVSLVGAIGKRNDGPRLSFDLPTLERLGLVRYAVRDPWDQRRIVFTGVLLADLLDVADVPATARRLRLTALDDYETTIEIADARRWPILLATRADGDPIAVAAGGPTRIVFPYGQYEFDRGRYDAQWIWSVESIVVR